MLEILPLSERVEQEQRRASHPFVSAWVSAHAGSGKTYVLTQRVIRLLLQGVAPQAILCLTFTKAAATNMSLRIFKILSDWVAYSDADLTAALQKMEGAHFHPTSAHLTQARRLFAKAVETPGGLKIQTIHAFCERILHLFPFEARIPADFKIIEAYEQANLLTKACEDIFQHILTTPDHPLQRALAFLSPHCRYQNFESLLQEALVHRHYLQTLLEEDPYAEAYGQALGEKWGLPPGSTPETITQQILSGGLRIEEWEDYAQRLDQGGANDQKRAQDFRHALSLCDPNARREAYLDIFFTDTRSRRGMGKTHRLISQALQKKDGELLGLLEAEQNRLALLLTHYQHAIVLQKTQALFSLCYAILMAYQDKKKSQGLLDFDDLIEYTQTLLSPSQASWVLYKLDASIDHILVDEAQDTSPSQWEILRALADEFLSGEGARTVARTFFAVGDEKQSIYSFHGAAPHMFEEMRRYFSKKHVESEKKFEYVTLRTSFRSSPVILAAIDSIFTTHDNYQGLSSENVPPLHEAFKAHLPGLMEIWEVETPQALPEPTDWRLPLDQPLPSDPAIRLAQKIAQKIKAWLDPTSAERVHDSKGQPRPIRPEDILILVRARGAFFEAVIKALKNAHIPVAGADRLVLGTHIAILDLLALGRFCLLPQDDLSLACLLKSPLLGLEEEDLQQIAIERPESLWEALKSASTSVYQQAVEKLERWRQQAREQNPFEFYSYILNVDQGRRAFLGRLGEEAQDALDEFLQLALTYDQTSAPSLYHFLDQFGQQPREIRRDMDATGSTIRVMTVHAAKGLEAKIVILADTCGAESGQHDPLLMEVDQDVLIWRGRATEDSALMAEVRERAREKEAQEHRRLLYVALTRAEERLYIGGFEGARGRAPKCWYDRMRAGL